MAGLQISSKVRIGKVLAYILRHDPRTPMGRDGFVGIEYVLQELRRRGYQMSLDELSRIILEDEKGRFELRGDMVRALYGHSRDVEIKLPKAEVSKLYHGTSRRSLERIMKDGLLPMGRRKVHLSASVEDAVEVGRRRDLNPIVLEVDVKRALEHGVNIEKVNDRVYVADRIPPKFLRVLR